MTVTRTKPDALCVECGAPAGRGEVCVVCATFENEDEVARNRLSDVRHALPAQRCRCVNPMTYVEDGTRRCMCGRLAR